MTEAEIHIDYLDPDGFKRTHSVRSEIEAEDFLSDLQESIDVVTKDGFFLVMEETQYVFIPPGQVLRITFSLINEEEGS
ncbi:hypothetical protein [Streptomyces ardesiacus]|uniref:hypothetical protein n=1 Tax=Streptomyces ardesiacus TaxID=285564 RepID=UPI00365198B0